MPASQTDHPDHAKGKHPAQKEGIVLLNFGGPRSQEEVRAFIYGIFADPNTVQLPCPQWLQNLLARWVAKSRAPEVQQQYNQIGGHSPIFQATETLAADLREQLKQRGYDWQVYVVHRYLPQQAKDTVQELVDSGVQRLHALTMQPHFSWVTTGSSLQQLVQLLEQHQWLGTLTAQRSYPTEPTYIDALEDRLRATLKKAGIKPQSTLILCSAHGLPRKYVEQGDPYQLDIRASVEALQARLPEWQFELSFQSKVGPFEWLQPYTDKIIETLPARAVRNLVFVPISFVNDHIETLYEIGITYCSLAEKHGMKAFRVAAIENHPSFMAWLTESAIRGLRGKGGIPPQELLPPSQRFQRIGWWQWTIWLLALFTSLLLAQN